jgi:formylglycine-generating enzyme required for sulfatase activity
MVWIPGGQFLMGGTGEHAGPAELPRHPVEVDGFFMDVHDVTNAEFAAFVEATGYVTAAERAPTAEEIMRQAGPGAAPPPSELLVAGSVVFSPTAHEVDLRDPSQWWSWKPGASWRRPLGPGSDIDGKDDYPVVHVTLADAMAYAAWAGKRLPTEAEWELAARGGKEGAEHVWGDAPFDPEHPQAHIYDGTFPTHPADVKPVGTYSANPYGLLDMSGNVWQWTSDVFDVGTYQRYASLGVVRNPSGPQATPRNGRNPDRVLRGGSYLCSDSYCRGYRISARQPGDPESGASHIGFRTVMTVAQWKARASLGGTP